MREMKHATPETHVALGGDSAAEELGGEYIEDVLAGAVPKQRVIVVVVCNKTQEEHLRAAHVQSTRMVSS